MGELDCDEAASHDEDALGPLPDVPDVLACEVACIFEALDTLSEDHKEAFRLKFQDQLTYREISQIMGKSLGTVSKLITTALCTVRDRLMAAEALRQES